MNISSMIMRSLLFVPGHSDKLLQSAARSDADVLILDVEDSVLPESNKIIARENIKKYVKSGAFSKFGVFIRLNERNSGHLLADVTELAIDGVDGFLYSKTYDKEDVVFFDRLLECIEHTKGFSPGMFKIIPILETAASIVNSDAISKASTRVVTIGFGSEDFVSDMGAIRDFDDGVSIASARAWVAMVARANNMNPIDAAYIHVHDLVGLENHLRKGRLLGYSGMWTLHPNQIELVNKYYSPSETEVADALDILRINELARKSDRGVAIIEGKFVGPPLVVSARKIIDKSNSIKAQRAEAKGK